ncbi:hypothetical protein, partial [Streptomyces scopuliridis]|uniref:hypothetical protein n=1 Tax=Streptomyces scopuliridis TaxID=452529 RepID=UPI0019CF842E
MNYHQFLEECFVKLLRRFRDAFLSEYAGLSGTAEKKEMLDINLVDPASSHTLVSKIKPCMSKYKQLCTVKLRMAHYISYSLLDST